MLTTKNATCKKLISLLVFTCLSLSPFVYAEDDQGRRIMSDVDDRYRGDTWVMDVYLLLTDEDGNERERTLKMLGNMFGKDEKTLSYVLEPARLRGTGILTYDWADPERGNESWLYLPDLGRVTRLSTASRSDYFLGTDFTYGDLEGLEVEDFSYEVDENLSSENEVVVIATPRNRDIVDQYGYTKVQYWVDTERDVYTKAQYWLKNEGWIKYYSQFDFDQIDGVWVSAREQMIMTRNNQRVHSTVITRGDIQINSEVPDGTFTTNGLERAAQ